MKSVENIFDDMAGEYDSLSDLWYSWLFSRLHFFIASSVLSNGYPEKVLDVGCGTGFQSFLYAMAGCEVHGLDIASNLIEMAKKKIKSFNPENMILFPEYYDYVRRYNNLIRNCIKNNTGRGKYIPPKFFVGNAMSIDYNAMEFNHVNCCGSTLSFVPDHEKVLSEIARVLKPNGTFFIEVENRWSFNNLWYILDPFLKGKFEYNKDHSAILKFLKKKTTQSIWINFPFGEYNAPINMKLHLFTPHVLKTVLMKYGLIIKKKWSIHSLTSLIPCTFLDCLNPTKKLIKHFKFLAKLEERLPFRVPGSSLVLYGTKG
ncbi:MAG: class I SAM-dependent methyltransferase [Promethearchaeota archaeon]